MVEKVLIVRGREITLRPTTHIELGVLHRTVVGAVIHSAAEVIVKRVVPVEAAAACRLLDLHRPTTSKCWAQMRHVLVNVPGTVHKEVACLALDHHRPTTSKCWAQMRHVLVNVPSTVHEEVACRALGSPSADYVQVLGTDASRAG